MILGTQRGGTTSLFDWLATHRSVAPSTTKEVHYFDRYYANGERWYRAHFPLKLVAPHVGGGHPLPVVLSPRPQSGRRRPPRLDSLRGAVARPGAARHLAVLALVPVAAPRTSPCEVALALEDERLAGQDAIVSAGGESFAHRNFSYKARGHYAEQLRRWFAVVERDRFLVMESEELWSDPSGPARALRVAGVVTGRPRRFPPPTTHPGHDPRRRPSSRTCAGTSPPTTRTCSSCWAGGSGQR